MSDENDYEVGYGKPPEDTRFKPGQSGNPNGRPKKTRDLEKLFERELSQTIHINENGQPRAITKREAIVKTIVLSALKGDHRAQTIAVGFMAKQPDVDGLEINAAAEAMLQDFLNQQSQTAGETDGSQN